MRRKYLITRKSDGALWAGVLFGFSFDHHHAAIFDTQRAAFAELAEVDAAPTGEHAADCWVEPADWYLTPDELQAAL